jgi:Gpi18-like mannosyltransferase
VLGNFLASRLIVFIFGFLLAPHVFLPRPEKPNFRPSFSWSEMNQWDGKWYERIATSGYEYQPDGREHDISFFPLYPALVWLVMRTGMEFAPAGIIISNFAFLGALYLLYQRTAEHSSESAARWAVAGMAWFPTSVLCSATYTESLFLLVTLALLQAFEKEHYWVAALLAASVALCRVPGITIAPAIVLFAFLRRLPWRAYVPAAAACLALSGFMVFQALRFHDPLAFVHEQKAWEHLGWFDVLRHFYRPNDFLRIVALPTSGLLLWSVRRKLCQLDLFYSLFSLAIIVAARQLGSVHRFVFAIASMFIAAGIWLSSRQTMATAMVALSGLALSFESVAWAWDHFIG